MLSDILLFGGQGLNDSASNSKYLKTKSTVAGQFLTACFAALISDTEALNAHESTVFGEAELALFESPQALVLPHLSLHTNVVVQGTTLYVHQILAFLDYLEEVRNHPDLASGTSSSQLIETAGFCSGILVAVLAAAYDSAQVHEFLPLAVDGFRLSFRIGLQNALFCQSLSPQVADSTPWSLTTSGLSVQELETLLSEFNDNHSPQLPLRIATVLGERTVSLSGVGKSLSDFRSNYVPSSRRSSWAKVHGYYHGGQILEQLSAKITVDVQKLGITFPTWDKLQLRVRSTSNGGYLDKDSSSMTLLDAALQAVLIDQVDWNTAMGCLHTSVMESIAQGSKILYRALALGPNSRQLLRPLKDRASHSQFHIEEFTSSSINGPSMNDIAIVGMSVNFPKGKGKEQLWQILENGLNAVEEIPASRFNVTDYHNSEGSKQSETKTLGTKFGNFIQDPFAFDNSFFHISPREAKSMDPQQRLLLHAAFEALEDAGYTANATPSFQTESMGVYVGVATLDYVDNTRNDIDVYYSPGTLRAFLAGRISYAFQFKGPAVVVDTACSSSTVAIYQACRALQAGDCTSALVGGVNVISSPDMYLGLSRAHFLSSTGQCKPWDASADGYCRAEGCGMFVLKRLADAVSENDRIYGVIRGVEVNQCGTAKSITHPDSDTQAALIRSLLTKSKITPESINIVEAHGTGTQAGDFAEASSLHATLCANRTAGNPLHLLSIKGNIGHAEAASGSAGLAKLLLMMQKRSIAPQASFKQLNPRLTMLNSNSVNIPTTLTDWRSVSAQPRRAILNNFGAAGSNAALIVEEFVPHSASITLSQRSAHILTLSAKTKDALENLRGQYCKYLSIARQYSDLVDLCYSTNARRQQFDAYRISVVGKTQQELASQLESITASPLVSTVKASSTVFVFSGQGAVHPGMGAEFLSTAPVFRDSVNTCDQILTGMGFPSVQLLIGSDVNAFGAVGNDIQAIVSQCACFVLEYALAKLWLSWGVKPDVLIGHSIGEYVALAISGAVSLRDALFLVGGRAELMVKMCKQNYSAMLACNVAPTKAESLLSQSGICDLSICCKNSPDQCVVAGPIPSLKQFAAFCKSSGIKNKLLETPYGFHSAAMDPIMEPFMNIASKVTTCSPKIPVISSYLGRLLSAVDLHATYFTGHTRQPVEFLRVAEVVGSITDSRSPTFIEIGPAVTTLPLLKASLQNTRASFLPSIKPAEKPWLTISTTLRSLFLQRCSITWRTVYTDTGARFISDIPQYPLLQTTFVVPFKEPPHSNPCSNIVTPLPKTSHKFLRDAEQKSFDELTAFRLNCSVLAPYIKAHRVGGAPLCPASVYIELALDTIMPEASPMSDGYYALNDISFDKPLVYSDESESFVLTTFDARDNAFQVASNDNNVHCKGSWTVPVAAAVERDFTRKASFIKRQKSSISFTDTFTSRVLYDVIFPRVVSYSGSFVTIKQLSVATSGLEGFGSFQLPETDLNGFVCPPAFTDTLLHAAGFVANSKVPFEQACICVKVEKVTIPKSVTHLVGQQLGVYCSLLDNSDGVLVGEAYAYDVSGKVVASIEGMHFQKLRLKSFQTHLARALKPQSHGTGHDSNTTMVTKSGSSGISMPTTQSPITRRLSSSRRRLSTMSKDGGDTVYLTPARKVDVRSILLSAASEVCGIDGSIDTSLTLTEIGIDSLLFIELTQNLQNSFAELNLVKSDLEMCETLAEIESLIETSLKSAIGVKAMPVVHECGPTPATQSASGGKSRISVTQPKIDFQRFKDFFEEVCGMSLDDCDKQTSLSLIGIDSLLSIELFAGLRDKFDVHIPEDSDLSELTIAQFEKLVTDRVISTAAFIEPSEPHVSDTSTDKIQKYDLIDRFPSELQNAQRSSAPAYLFHDGSGLCNVYSRIHNIGRDLRGIFSLDFKAVDNSIQTMQQLAALYIEQAKLSTMKHVILGGWSFGGVLAFEVSRQLRRHGNIVKGIVLIDSPHPVSHDPLPAAIIKHISNTSSTQSKVAERLKDSIEAQFQRNAYLLANYHPQPDPEDPPCIMLKCRDTFDAKSLCNTEYPWVDNHTFRDQSIKVWESLIGKPIPVYEVDGHHFDLFTPEHIESVSTQFRRACDLLDC